MKYIKVLGSFLCATLIMIVCVPILIVLVVGLAVKDYITYRRQKETWVDAKGKWVDHDDV